MKWPPKIPTNFNNPLLPDPWETWSPTPASSQRLSDYTSYSDLLRYSRDQKDQASYISADKLDKYISLGATRRAKIKFYTNWLPFVQTLSCLIGALTLAGVFIGWVKPASKFFEDLWIPIGLLFAMLFICGYGFRRLNKLRRAVLFPYPQSKLTDASGQLDSAVQHILKETIENELSLFTKEANGVIYAYSSSFIKADGVHLALYAGPDAYVAVALDGIPPTGELLVLKEGLRDILNELPKRPKTINPPTLLHMLSEHERFNPFVTAIHNDYELCSEFLKRIEKRNEVVSLSVAQERYVSCIRVIHADWEKWMLHKNRNLNDGRVFESKLIETLGDMDTLYAGFCNSYIPGLNSLISELEFVSGELIDKYIQRYLDTKKKK